jgi:hypothetical protein
VTPQTTWEVQQMSHEEGLIGRWVAGASLAGLFAVVCGVACGEIDNFPEVAVSASHEAIRLGLQACTPLIKCPAGLACCAGFCATPDSGSGKLASLNADQRLSYKCYASSPGSLQNPPLNILPDFSHAGYMGGGVAIPNATAFGSVIQPVDTSGNGDHSDEIQAALDACGAWTNANGITRAVELAAGTFTLKQPLWIRENRVVLRGQGQGPGGTVLRASIPVAHTLIKVRPHKQGFPDDPELPDYPATLPIQPGQSHPAISGDVPVGATVLSLAQSPPYTISVDNPIVVVRTPNNAWIADVRGNYSEFDSPWTPTGFVTKHLRTVKGWNASTRQLTIDIPIVDAIHAGYGGGYVARIETGRFIEQVGIEDLRLDTEYVDQIPQLSPDHQNCDCPDGDSCLCSDGQTPCQDEDGNWNGISFERVRNSWVRRVTVRKYGMAAVAPGDYSSFNTFEEVAHIEPKSPFDRDADGNPTLPKSSHRYSFGPSNGVGNLFQRCYTSDSRHPFVTGPRKTGPHVWLDCLSVNQYAAVGPHQKWTTGLLFDNVKTELNADALAEHGPGAIGMVVEFEPFAGSGHGWTGAQVMFWNGESAAVNDAPKGAMNWLVGGIVTRYQGKLPEDPSGIAQLDQTTVKPRSLYLQQLADRLGTSAVDRVTTPEQRNGRIWDGLRAWAGNGRLDDFYPNPTCASPRGKPSGGGVCCAGSCSQCGGPGCPGDSCCTIPIREADRSCAHYPAPCVMPDPLCLRGQPSTDGKYCCSDECPACGVAGCSDPPHNPPAVRCCTSGIQTTRRSCLEYPAPCVMNDTNCVSGVEGFGVCCPAFCPQCGGPGCGGLGGCCSSTIEASGISCENSLPPCILAADRITVP